MGKVRASPEMARTLRALAGIHCSTTGLHQGICLPKGLAQISPALGNRFPRLEVGTRRARHLGQDAQPLGFLHHIAARGPSGKVGELQRHIFLVRINGNTHRRRQEGPRDASLFFAMVQGGSYQDRRLIHVTRQGAAFDVKSQKIGCHAARNLRAGWQTAQGPRRNGNSIRIPQYQGDLRLAFENMDEPERQRIQCRHPLACLNGFGNAAQGEEGAAQRRTDYRPDIARLAELDCPRKDRRSDSVT
ncbi:hypothetical protein HFO19_21560 [Rhizobium laguerreae]|nr:hypothetical protein [Rhizobium laguerreae]